MSATDASAVYGAGVGRWPGGTRRRVQEAALALFAERGYAATTVDDIAARAEVSARTVFRHFRDKEEVLFDADDALAAVLLDTARTSPTGAPPLAVVRAALAALVAVLEPDRPALRRRASVLASDIALQGRDLAKQARWTATLSEELVARGTDPATAALLTATGAAALRTCYAAWLADSAGAGLGERLDAAWAGLADALRSPDGRWPSAQAGAPAPG